MTFKNLPLSQVIVQLLEQSFEQGELAVLQEWRRWIKFEAEKGNQYDR